MGGKGRPFQYFVAFSLLLLCLKAWCNGEVGCIEREREALLEFKQGVVDYFGLLSSWEDKRSDDCCKYRKGVKCDNLTGHVIDLNLAAAWDEMSDLLRPTLRGKLNPSLAELRELKHLNLSFNDFEGSLPPQVGNLSKLQSLDLRWNGFAGSLPTDQLGNLSNLKYLDLGLNYGNMRCENLDWLFRLPLLTHLDLSGVDLSKAVHWAQAINKMHSLTELYLSNAQLPRIFHVNSSSFSSLAVLDLSLNDLGTSNSIYQWLFNLFRTTSLVHLDLSCNMLNASILLDAIGNMTTLAYLDLSWNQLSSSIPNAFENMMSSTLVRLDLSWNQLHGSIPNAFGTQLDYVDLSGNKLHGVIPNAFGNTTSLTHLDLSWNQLHGSIPDGPGNMTNLAFLDLSNNQLEGEIPKSFLRYSCKLETLFLSTNNLTGPLEKDFLACSNYTLEVMDLSYNQLRGTSFPLLHGFSQLRKLDLSFNQLNGTLPVSIGQLAELQELQISSNSLQGLVSANHLFGLSHLYYIDLSFNSLTFNISQYQVPLFQASHIMLAACKLGPSFPYWLHTQKGLSQLDISASGISDVIPSWFWNILYEDSYWLNISNNCISGTLPHTQAIASLGMDLSSNCLQGSIPQSIFNAQWLDLSNNMFSGPISLSCESTSQSRWGLSHLDLSNNRLSGELPKCWEQWEYLVILNLANNNLSGKIKNSIGLLHKLQTLHLQNNSLTGALPSSLKNCTDLYVIDLGRNKFSGRIPMWMGKSLSSLIVVNLRSNEFSGSIPLSLCELNRIQMLDLSYNDLFGTIPKCLNNLTALVYKGSGLTISYDVVIYKGGWEHIYVDNTLVQWKGKEREYKKTLGLIKIIDFSSNKLTGEIPIEVTDLVELVSLNLSRNNLSGPIPTTIGQFKSLDFLDLSQNQLNGEIPHSLSQIAGLSVLDLSNNTLSGKIPLGTQLQSFDATAYEGNPVLCGLPLLEKCPKEASGEVSFTGLGSEKEGIQDDKDNIAFYTSVALGFIIGFWGVCGILLFKRSWRCAYFQYLSKINDWLYVTTMVTMNRIKRSLQS